MRFRDTSFNFRLLMSAAAVGLMAGGAAAQEQDTSGDAEARQETVVVTGFRQSLQQAIAVKRNETGIVDAISAEDIADFPDLNLAEALQRVPGVQIDRDGGEGRSINVRGLSSDFVRVQINGMEALATTGGRDGRANRNRQFDFNVFAADLFTSVKVAKSQDAKTDEGSLGATVQLRSAKPFDYDGFTFATGAQASYNDLSEETDPRITALVSNTWLDGRLGGLLSVAYSTRNTFEEGSSSLRFRVPADDGCVAPFVNLTRCYQSVGTITTADGTVLTGAAAAAAAANGAHPRIPRYGRIGYDRERLGVTGALQFEPWAGTEITFDSLYAQLDQTRSEEFLEVISFAREAGVQGLRTVDLVSGVLDDNRTLVSGTFNDVDVRTEQRIDILATEFFQNSLSFESEISDKLRLSGMAGVSRAIGKNPQQTTISLEAYDIDGYQYDYSDPNLPFFNYNFDVNNPANYVFSSSTALGDASIIRLRPNKTLNSYETGRLDLAYDINDIFTITGGVSYKEFGFDVKEWRKASEGVTATTLTALAANGYTLADYTTVLTNFGQGMDLPAGTPTSWIIPDLNAVRQITGFDCNCINQYGDWRLTRFDGETRGAIEKSTGAYVQVDWNADLGYVPIRGNIGVRYVETDLTSFGILSGAEETVNFKYEDTLPAMNIVLEPFEDVLLRFAAAKTMARPNLTALTPGGSIDSSPPGLSLTAGNPFLEPIRSNNVDISLEWYPYEEALFSVALFRKNIESFNQRLLRTIPYSETGFPNSLLGPGVTPDDLFNVTTFVNTPGGVLNGVEVTAQTPFNFDFIPEPLQGFGGIISYTKIDSEFDYIINVNSGATVTQPLVGQSPESLSATLYYERGPFEARISSSWRDEYLTTVPAASGNDVEGKAATLNLDFSASYELTDKIELTFEAINLTDVYDERWINSDRQNSLNYEHTGREFVFGIRYRY
ncbi:TonB-dependent receptor [Hyphomonas sp.]|uniref:TonB-dependent receptor n=1 Tax=Hyphomonas sp. TaxID=87 RepID=UPI0039196BBC